MGHTSAESLNGSCLCGAVTFEIQGSIPDPDACHCTQCRKFSGHFFASTDVPRSAIKISGNENLSWYQTENVKRGFCKTCGSSMFWDPIERDWIGVAMGSFESTTNTKLKLHIFVKNKGDYYDLKDGVQQNPQ